MTLVPVLIAAALLAAAVFLSLFARDQRRLGGLPEGDLIYNDELRRGAVKSPRKENGLRRGRAF